LGIRRKATVLAGKLEIIIFEEAVHEDDEVAQRTGRKRSAVYVMRRKHGIERFGGRQWWEMGEGAKHDSGFPLYSNKEKRSDKKLAPLKKTSSNLRL
jgi:hypothetical protein